MMNKMDFNPRGVADGTRGVRRAIALTRMLSTHTSSGWRLTDLAMEAGLEHTTAHRLLKCLVEE